MNSNLVIMNRVPSVAVFGHTSTSQHADGEGDGLLLFLFVPTLSLSLSLWVEVVLSSVFHTRSRPLYLIIILSAARAWLIDVPLNCLLQADDLTKALCST